MISTLRPLSSGEILDAAFALYRRHFVVLYTTALLPAMPLAALGGGAAYRWLHGSSPGRMLASLLVAGPLCALVTWGALLQQVSSAVLGRPVTVAEGYRAGLGRIVPLLVVGVVLGLGWLLFTLVGVAGVGGGAIMVAALGVPGVLLAILLWVGGVGGGQLAFFSLFFAAPAVVVLERRGPFSALNRAMELGRDALPRSMAVLGVCAVIMLLPALGLSLATGLLGPDGAAAPGGAGMLAQQAGSLLVGSLTLPYLAACATLLYYDRRIRTEAFDVQLVAEQLAAG